MSKSVNVDFVTRQIEVDTDGKEYYVSAAVAAKDAEQSMLNAQNAANRAEYLVNGNFPYVTPEMFGAIGDGVADDTDAVQKAFDFGRIIVLKNTYRLLNAIFISNSNTIVKGSGCLFFDNANHNNLLNNSLIANRNEGLENCTFDGIRLSIKPKDSDSLFRFFRCKNIHIVNNTIEFISDSYAPNAIVDLFQGNSNITIQNNICIINAPKEYGGFCWIRNYSNEELGYTNALDTDNIVITDNYIESNCGDEVISIFTTNDSFISNIMVCRNTIVRSKNTVANQVVSIFAKNDNHIKDVIINDNIIKYLSNGNVAKYCIRLGAEIGSEQYYGSIENLNINNNIITGIKATALTVYGSNSPYIVNFNNNILEADYSDGTIQTAINNKNIIFIGENNNAKFFASFTNYADKFLGYNYLDGEKIKSSDILSFDEINSLETFKNEIASAEAVKSIYDFLGGGKIHIETIYNTNGRISIPMHAPSAGNITIIIINGVEVDLCRLTSAGTLTTFGINHTPNITFSDNIITASGYTWYTKGLCIYNEM